MKETHFFRFHPIMYFIQNSRNFILDSFDFYKQGFCVRLKSKINANKLLLLFFCGRERQGNLSKTILVSDPNFY